MTKRRMTYNKIFCKITRDENGKKRAGFGKVWGNMPKRKANAEATLTGDGLMVLDIDTKDLSKVDSKLVELLGEPTVETYNGYHYYFTGDVEDIKQTQGLFHKVDVRNTGGLVFSGYWGDDESISYKVVGEPVELKGKLKKYLLKASKKRRLSEQKRVGKIVDVDGTWPEIPEGEVHSTILAFMIRDFKAGATYDEVWSKSMLYIDRYLHGYHTHEDRLFKMRIEDTFKMFGNERYGFKPSSKGFTVHEPVTNSKKLERAEKGVHEDEKGKVVDYRFDEDWMKHKLVCKKKIKAYLLNSGWDASKSKTIWVSSSGRLREFLRNDSHAFYKDIRNSSLKGKKYTKEMDKTLKEMGFNKPADFWKHIRGRMLDWVMFHHQYKTLRVKVDPFADNSVHFEDKTMVVVTNDLIPRKVETVEDPKVMKDYKKHFPQLDMILDLMLAGRFGADRKECYLWMKAESNWGKSFLFGGVLQNMGITTFMKEQELKKAMSGEPSGLNAEDFSKSWLTVFEEFKGAVSELKDITHSLILAPKGQSRVEVDLYFKIFLSAENVNSLRGDSGAETQFANRFMMVDLKGSLVRRKLYSEDQRHYLAVVRSYVYNYLMKGIEEYIALGAEKCSVKANNVLQKFRKLHKLEAEDLMEAVNDRLVEYYTMIRGALDPKMGVTVTDKFKYGVEDSFIWKDGELYCVNLGKAKEHLFDNMFGVTDVQKLNHKTSREVLGLMETQPKTVRLNKVPRKSYLISDSYYGS